MTEETRSAGESTAAAPVRGWRAAFPPAQWLASYQPKWLANDAIAGVTLAAYGIPVSLAYASLAGLPPQYGIYCYLVGGLFYALFGSSRQLAIGPTSAISMLVGVTIAGMAEGNPERWASIAALTALVMAVMCVLAWLLRLSSLVNFISGTILLGFKAGAALTIAMTQLPKLFGVKGGGEHFFARIVILGGQLSETNLAVLAFGLAALGVLLLGEKLLPGRPVALFVVVVSIIVLSVTPLADLGFNVVGALPQGLPEFRLPGLRVRDVDGVIPLAFACLLLAYVESVSAARALARAATSSLFLGSDVVSSESIRRLAIVATSTMAWSNTAWFAFDGLLKPLSFRTNCSDAARISSSVAGGSKLKSVLMFLHMIPSSPSWLSRPSCPVTV